MLRPYFLQRATTPSYSVCKNFWSARFSNSVSRRKRLRAPRASPSCSSMARRTVVARPSCRNALAKRVPARKGVSAAG